MSGLADILRLRVLDRRCRRALLGVLALRAWQWLAQPVSLWSYVPGTSGVLYGYSYVTSAYPVATVLVPLSAYAFAAGLEALLDPHRLVRMRSRGMAAGDFLAVAAGRAFALSSVTLVSGLVVAVPQVPGEAVTPQLVLALVGILARQALFLVVCAALMLAAYALTSLVPASAVAALAYGSVGYLLQGRLEGDTLLDRWGWLCALPPHDVFDPADSLACMGKYAAAIAALTLVSALALSGRDVLDEGGGSGERDVRSEGRLVPWLPLRRRYLGRVGVCVGASALVAFLLSRGDPVHALARLHGGATFLPNDFGIDLFGMVGALLPSLALAWLLAGFLSVDLAHAPLLWPRLSCGDGPQLTDARTRWALMRTGQLALLAGAYGLLAPTAAAAACLPGSTATLGDVTSTLAQVLPFSVAGSVLLVLVVNLLALRLDVVIAWAAAAVAHATTLVACVFLPEPAVAALAPWLPSTAATAAFHAPPIGASTPLSLVCLLLLVLLASALVVRETRRLDVLGGDRHD